MTTSACDRVTTVPELIEQILLHFSPRELLQLQRVNSAFRASITGTPSLQRQLNYMFWTQAQERSSATSPHEPDTPAPEHTSPFASRPSTHDGKITLTCQTPQDSPSICATVTIQNQCSHHRDYTDILSHTTQRHLDRWLQARGLPIKFTIQMHNDFHKTLAFEEASITVKLTTTRELLALAASLHRAGKRLEGDRRYEQEWEWDEMGMLIWEHERPKYDFDWKEFLTADQLEKVLQAPEFKVWRGSASA